MWNQMWEQEEPEKNFWPFVVQSGNSYILLKMKEFSKAF